MTQVTRQPTKQLAERVEPRLEADPKESGRRPILHHVQLKTFRLEEMIDWYGDVVGLTTCYRGSGSAWLTNDESNHRLALLGAPGLVDDPEKVDHVGLHHTGWEFPHIDDLLATYARLRDRGELPHRTVNHGVTTSFYYTDPDGNSVELQVDNFGDWTESVHFFQSDDFANDPFGPGVDPEALIEQRAAGVEPRELALRSRAGEFPEVIPNNRRVPE